MSVTMVLGVVGEGVEDDEEEAEEEVGEARKTPNGPAIMSLVSYSIQDHALLTIGRRRLVSGDGGGASERRGGRLLAFHGTRKVSGRDREPRSGDMVGVSLATDLDPEVALGVGLGVDQGAAVELVRGADDGIGLLPLLQPHQ